MTNSVDEHGWTCAICGNICMSDWTYCPYCGEPVPDEDEL